MNPYDFARIDWSNPPERHTPIWHHRLANQGTQSLFSGYLEGNIYAETPLFIADPRAVPNDPKKPAQPMRNQKGDYIIPGSSLKGMLRTLVETLGNGCLTLFDGRYERGRVDYLREVPRAFQHCDDNSNLCIACRMFGMLKEGARGVLLGKVTVGDAYTSSEQVYTYEPLYTKALMEPKPHHASFYLDQDKIHIAGRKYYFHHSPNLEPLQENRLIVRGGGRADNRYIQPLDRDTRFSFRVDFTNLEANEFAVLLMAIVLEENMRHKIGYGKPTGLGSINLAPTSLTLVDYASRYKHTGENRGISSLTGDAMWNRINEQLDIFYNHFNSLALQDLQRIWRWPPEPNVYYYYPSKRDWFDTQDSLGKRIADTRNVP